MFAILSVAVIKNEWKFDGLCGYNLIKFITTQKNWKMLNYYRIITE
jgi:hypothetical protein